MKNKTLFFLFLITLSQGIKAGQIYGPYQGEVLGVIDGDTILVKFNVLPGSYHTYKIRQAGIDTPEKRSTSRRKVPDCEKQLAKLASQFTIDWLRDKDTVTVSDIEEGMYFGRLIGDISYNGEKLSDALIENGHARVYVNKSKDRKAWCK